MSHQISNSVDSASPESLIASASADSPVKSGMSRRQFLGRAAGGLSAVAAGTFLYTWRIEPHWVDVVERPLPVAKLPSSLLGRRLVQLSDLHIGAVVDHDYITGAIASVARLEPDLIVITGDMMTCRLDEQIEQTLGVLKLLPQAPLGRFAILGNHDYGWAWRQTIVPDKLAAKLDRRGITLLRNETVDAGGLQIVGVDDLWSGRMSLPQAFSQYDPERASIALCHNPDTVDLPDMQSYRDWVLAGHTHGGQCKPPFFAPPILPVENLRYTSGEIALDNGGKMYINRGLGYTHRVRFNCRPEITVFTLAAADAKEQAADA